MASWGLRAFALSSPRSMIAFSVRTHSLLHSVFLWLSCLLSFVIVRRSYLSDSSPHIFGGLFLISSLRILLTFFLQMTKSTLGLPTCLLRGRISNSQFLGTPSLSLSLIQSFSFSLLDSFSSISSNSLEKSFFVHFLFTDLL
jgi:hypothetical protein